MSDANPRANRPRQLNITLSLAEDELVRIGYAAERELCLRGGKKFTRSLYGQYDQGWSLITPRLRHYLRRALLDAAKHSIEQLYEKHGVKPPDPGPL